jgi:transposase-like protein
MEKVTIRRYSLAFKQAVVREYEAGESMYNLRRKYGINGMSTIKRWVEQYGLQGTRHKLMVISSPDEQSELVKLQARIAELEKALAQTTLDNLMLKATLEVAEQKYGITPKKTTAQPSSSTPKQPKQRSR